METVYFFSGFTQLRFYFQVIRHVDSFDHQDVSVFFDFSACVCGQEAFSGRNVTRFQRAAKSAGQSAAGRGHHIVQGSCVG